MTALGDFSVTYRIAGLLKDVKSMLSARSNLHKSVMDCLHEAGIEIVSPSFMNQRPQEPGVQVIPQAKENKSESESSAPEAVVFDKAEQAESQLKSKEAMEKQLSMLKEQLPSVSGEEKESLKQRIDTLTSRLEASEQQHEEQKESP